MDDTVLQTHRVNPLLVQVILLANGMSWECCVRTSNCWCGSGQWFGCSQACMWTVWLLESTLKFYITIQTTKASIQSKTFRSIVEIVSKAAPTTGWRSKRQHPPFTLWCNLLYQSFDYPNLLFPFQKVDLIVIWMIFHIHLFSAKS